MSYPSSQPSAPIPRWLIWAGSIAIVFHLGVVGVNTLAAPSGPWPGPEGGEPVRPPFLATQLNSGLLDYLRLLRFNHNYHFLANRIPGSPEVYLEFRLKDEHDQVIATVRLPDDNVNPWIRHHQSLLTQQVAWEDERIGASPSEVIAAPGREVPTVQYWDMDKGQLKLVTVDVNQIPRNRPVSKPSEFSFLLARAYSRYLCRTYGAAKVEVLRHHQDPIRPYVLTEANVPAQAFNEIISNFGEFSR